MSKLENLKPEKVFHYFEEICAIPHGSRNTKAISDYLAEFAAQHHLEYYQDESNNIVMIQEASKGYEQAEPLIIQGHMDMVCEKENNVDIDFEKDGLDLYVDGDFLRARGTTLGGDDGIAVAYALAILDSPELKHPRLEVVITVDEEIGMLGAEAIELPMLKGKKLLNIDSDVEGHFLTSCAGGMTAELTLPVSYMTQKGQKYRLTITGLVGGHSGSEIDKERANAIVLSGRVLKYLADRVTLGVISLQGGLKDNAIPREVTTEVLVAEDEIKEFDLALTEITGILQKEYQNTDAGLLIEKKTLAVEEASILDYASFTRVLFYLRNMPNGVQNMSTVMPGLVETSLNAGIMVLDKEALHITHSIRSSVSTRKEDLRDKLTYLVEFLGGEIEVSGDYPAWEYKSESTLRQLMSDVYQELYKEEPVFEAIHAGLECGILSGKIEDLDCISFGPTNYDIHTPQERLSISSTERVWNLLVTFLERAK
ncbi:MAG: aminoacyl-histidine dipeptidase [Roseburia sp.]